MPAIPIWQIDAFTARPFSGNPAAVCLLDAERDAPWMQSVAAEMNLSETAFVRRIDDGFSLRWFTPGVEVDLCGHATLASAFALWSSGAAEEHEQIRFHTRSGVLTASRDGDIILLDFPTRPASPCDPPNGLLESLGLDSPHYVGATTEDRLLVVTDAPALRALRPDFRRLAGAAPHGVIVAAASDDPDFDFLSRFFAPAYGVDEDPVTGSAHCCLGPYWSERLGKSDMVARQISRRGGVVHLRARGDRVILGGRAVPVMRGELL
ncbi:MAG: PhzF family phenazine biosynthesis protein [Phycisphaeraceae bacterium]|nr:MAG: PhzF family phenazine biosynthesis protein [Phycisphaeraceae bacterium]